MKLHLLSIVSLIITSIFSILNADDPVIVKDVIFKKGNADWLIAGVKLDSQGTNNPEARDPDFVDKIKVTLYVAYEPKSKNVPAGRKLDVYKSEYEILSLRKGKPKLAYFGIAGEIALRDKLSLKPYAYLVELEVNGETLPLNKDHFDGLKSKELVDKVKSMADEQSSEHESVMVPYFLAPPGLYKYQDVAPYIFKIPESK